MPGLHAQAQRLPRAWPGRCCMLRLACGCSPARQLSGSHLTSYQNRAAPAQDCLCPAVSAWESDEAHRTEGMRRILRQLCNIKLGPAARDDGCLQFHLLAYRRSWRNL